MLSKQIRLVGLVARISRHPILLGGKGMNDAGFKTGAGKGSLSRQVIVSSPLNDHDDVLNVVLLLGLADLLRGETKTRTAVLHRLWFDEDVSKVIGHHPGGAMFGWIDADDAEMLAPHFLNTRTDDAVWFLQRFRAARS